MASKYDVFRDYLLASDENIIRMTFKEIESILGFKLPESNYKHQAVWANSDSHPVAKAWLSAGYLSESLNMKEQTIVFRRDKIKADVPKAKNKSGIKLVTKKQPEKCSMTPERAVKLIRDYYNETVRDPNGRYMSWRHCYNVFSENRGTTDERNIDYLALHLAFYLASWGMLRNSFLLQKDYKVHIPVVKIILEKRYDALQGISAYDLQKDENLNLLDGINERIKEAYANQIPSFEGSVNNATDTLLSKILLGTLGCVPAYDNYYKKAVREHGVSSGQYKSDSIKDVAAYYCNHEIVFEKLREELSECGTNYPPMKLMDMCFWQAAYMEDKY